MAGFGPRTGLSPLEVLLQRLGESCFAVAGFVGHGCPAPILFRRFRAWSIAAVRSNFSG